MNAEERERLEQGVARAIVSGFKIGVGDKDILTGKYPLADKLIMDTARATISAIEASGIVWLAPWEPSEEMLEACREKGVVGLGERWKARHIFITLREAATAGAEPAGEE